MKCIMTAPAENIFMQEKEIKKGNMPSSSECGIVNVFDDIVRQEILGFGGAFTESAAYNYSLMDDKTKEKFIRAYFDKESGIGYNFGRTHINSCDFSLGIYNYVKNGDMTLDSFDISRDKQYIIPFIKDALKYTGDELVLFASPWSPPEYMKDNNSMIKGGKLLDEYKELWALYYAKYIKAYRNEGINISAISVQNEPIAIQTWESCYYSPDDEREFIENYLIPVLDRENLSDIKIIIWDHNKERVYDRAKKILSSPNVNKRVWAVGEHWYSGDHYEGLKYVYEELHKPTILSEFCLPIAKNNGDGISAAEAYAREICENLNNHCIAVCDWNLTLNSYGGPYHNRVANRDDADLTIEDKTQGCYAPIIYYEETNEIKLTPTYYYIGHFSKYIERGAKLIGCSKYTDKLHTCAFLNPNGERVLVAMNKAETKTPVVIRNNDVCTLIEMLPHSIMTVIF